MLVSDASVRLWDLVAGADVRVLESHTGRGNSVAFSPDTRLLASVGDDASVRLCDVAPGAQTRVLEGHTGRGNSVAFSPDTRLLASVGDDASVRLWDLTVGATLLDDRALRRARHGARGPTSRSRSRWAAPSLPRDR